VVLVASLPPGEVVGVEVVEVVPEALPPLHDISPSASMKTTRIEIETDLECRNTTPLLLNQ
jgi:hypothetical protein